MFLYDFGCNGGFLPIVFLATLALSNNLFLACIITMKCYTSNYFFWFNDEYHFKNLPRKFNWIKQFVRFTDTGNLASILVYFDSSWLQIAFVVHFIITIGYWYGKCWFQMKDLDSVKNPRINRSIESFFCTCNHGLPLCFLLYFAINSDNTTFNTWFKNCLGSFLWMYTWATCIYLPWRLFTKDPVYELFDWNKTPFTISLFFVSIVHVVAIIGNIMFFFVPFKNNQI